MKKFSYLLTIIFIAIAANAIAADDYVITIKDHKFSPQDLVIPANQKVKVIVKNQDATPEEFESYDLHREKVVSANNEIILYLGPLDAGTYSYFGDFHKETAKATITVK